MFFSDLHVQILARGILNPGEQLVSQTVTDYMPWWAFGLVRRQHLVLATDQRLVVLDHRYDLLKVNHVLYAVESLPWNSVAYAKVTGLLFKKKLKVRGMNDRGQQIDISAKIPNSFLPWATTMKNNLDGAKQVVAAFQSRGQAAATLPPSSYNAPPQLQQPAINAPGYHSAPPPAPYAAPAQQVQQVQSPFAPPRQY